MFESNSKAQTFNYQLKFFMSIVGKRKLIKVLLVSLVAVAVESLTIGLIIPALTNIINSKRDLGQLKIIGFPGGAGLLIAVGMAVSLYSIKSIVGLACVWYLKGFSTRLDFDISAALFSKYLSLSYEQHTKLNTSDLIRRTYYASGVSSGFIEPIILVLSEITLSIVLLVLLLVINPVMTFITILILALTQFAFHTVSKSMVSKSGKMRTISESRRVRTISESLNSIKELYVFNANSYFSRKYQDDLRVVVDTSRKFSWVQAIPKSLLELTMILIISAVVIASYSMGQNQSELVLALVALAAVGYRIMPSLNQIQNALHTITFNTLLINEIIYDLNQETPRDFESYSFSVAGDVDLHEIIKMTNVSYRHAENIEYVLSDINLTIRSGEKVGIQGISGIGKSTFVDLCIGIRRPTLGMILNEGQDIWENINSWHKKIGYVPQSISLLEDSIAGNIAYGIPDYDIDLDLVNSLVDTCELRTLIDSLPRGLNSNIGQDGIRLSGGQRQRIGIARALYVQPAVLFLDEATSSLDEALERKLLSLINTISQKITVITISHREEAFIFCDRIFEIRDKRVLQKEIQN